MNRKVSVRTNRKEYSLLKMQAERAGVDLTRYIQRLILKDLRSKTLEFKTARYHNTLVTLLRRQKSLLIKYSRQEGVSVQRYLTNLVVQHLKLEFPLEFEYSRNFDPRNVTLSKGRKYKLLLRTEDEK